MGKKIRVKIGGKLLYTQYLKYFTLGAKSSGVGGSLVLKVNPKNDTYNDGKVGVTAYHP